MSVTFWSPAGALVALALAVPLVVFFLAERRARGLRALLGLRQSSLHSVLPFALALCALAGLLGLAAAQPVLERTKTRHVRTDAEAFFVFDTSRSMSAARSPGSASRFERARRAGRELRAALAEVPVGVASMTDRMLPHLFPTANSGSFERTLERAVGVERPPPQRIQQIATSYYSLSALATQNYFSDRAKRRLVVVLTDGEGTPFDQRELGEVFRAASQIRTIFVSFWNPDERVFDRNRKPEAAYRVDPTSGRQLDDLADVLAGRHFSEDELGAATEAALGFLGRGPRVAAGREDNPLELAPYAVLAAFVPLGFLLWSRNLYGLSSQLPQSGRPSRSSSAWARASISALGVGRPK